MRVVLTSHQFLPDYSAGTEILTYETAKELQRVGHDVYIITGYPSRAELAENERFDAYEYDGLPIRRFHHAHIPLGNQKNVIEAEYNSLFFARYFREYLKELRPDIVHFFHLARLSASAIDVCEELNIPAVMTPTDFWLVCPTNQLRLSDNSMCHGPSRYGVNCLRHVVSINQPKQLASRLNKVPSVAIAGIVWSMKRGAFSSKWYTPLTVALHNRPAFLRERMNKLAKVFAPTSLMKEVLLRHGLEPNKVRLLPYGINLSNVKRLPKKREPKNRLRLGFIGTLYEHKGPHVLISAIKKLNDFNGVLKIYGNESEFPSYVETLKQTSGTDRRIQFVGTFPNNQIGEVFSDLDALVVPSIWYENTPLVIYSAQAAGCPVVASNLGGMSEVIEDGINGRLFTPGNADELASIIEQLDANRTLLDRLGMNSRQPTSSSDYVRVLLEEYCSLMSPALV